MPNDRNTKPTHTDIFVANLTYFMTGLVCGVLSAGTPLMIHMYKESEARVQVPKPRTEFVRANKDTLNDFVVTDYFAAFRLGGYCLDSTQETYYHVPEGFRMYDGTALHGEYVTENLMGSAKIRADSAYLMDSQGNVREVAALDKDK
jgi:hypothetical protein